MPAREGPHSANPLLPKPFRILKMTRETSDVATFTLEPLEESLKMPSAAPGQFNMLYAFGVGEVPVSVSGQFPDGPLTHTVRAVGAVTEAICRLRRGDVVGLRGPFGSRWPAEEVSGKDVVIVAGGIGMAPLRGAVQQLLDRRDSFGRLTLLYGARTPRDLLYQRELSRWRSRFDVEVEITVDSAAQEWRGNVGVVPGLIAGAAFDPARTIAMVCGPEVMMRYTVSELRDHGLPEDAIYISMERNMKCAVGFCGRCQFGPRFICKDGPVFRYDLLAPFLRIREV